jgi:hypothetical protein
MSEIFEDAKGMNRKTDNAIANEQYHFFNYIYQRDILLHSLL